MKYEKIDYLFQLTYGYWKSHVLITATEFCIFTLIGDRRLSAGEIAKSIHANERATEMLLNALVSLELLTVQEKHYGNTPTSNLHLDQGNRTIWATPSTISTIFWIIGPCSVRPLKRARLFR